MSGLGDHVCFTYLLGRYRYLSGSTHPRKRTYFWELGSWRSAFGVVAELQHFHDQLWADKLMPNVLMVGSGMVLGPVVGIVELAGVPVDAEFFLAFAIAQPMEFHVHGLCALWLNSAVDYVFYIIVCLHQP